MVRDNHYQLLDSIIQIDGGFQQPQAKNYHTAFIAHLILHVIPSGLLTFDNILSSLLPSHVTKQLIILFIVIQFWFTKNIIGKRMLGYRWFFGQDVYGQQRLMYECRANGKFQSNVKSMLFWVVLIVYSVYSAFLIFNELFLTITTAKIEYSKVQLNIMIIIRGICNMFYYSLVSARKQLIYTKKPVIVNNSQKHDQGTILQENWETVQQLTLFEATNRFKNKQQNQA